MISLWMVLAFLYGVRGRSPIKRARLWKLCEITFSYWPGRGSRQGEKWVMQNSQLSRGHSGPHTPNKPSMLHDICLQMILLHVRNYLIALPRVSVQSSSLYKCLIIFRQPCLISALLQCNFLFYPTNDYVHRPVVFISLPRWNQSTCVLSS